MFQQRGKAERAPCGRWEGQRQQARCDCGRWLALQVPGQGELGTELAINNSRRQSRALAGCCRIPLSPESGYIQGSSSNLLAGELLNSSSALFPLYHSCVFLLSFLASNRLSTQLALWKGSSEPAASHTLLRSLLISGREKKPGEMSYRSTISIYKVSTGIECCSCLPGGDVQLGGEELIPAGNSSGGTAEGWICPQAELQQLLWALGWVWKW